MSPPIKNEAGAIKQEVDARSPRRTRAQAAMEAAPDPVAVKQEPGIPAVAPDANAAQPRAGVKRRRDDADDNAATNVEVDENGPPHPNPKGGCAKFTTEIDTNKFYLNFCQRAAKVIKFEPSLNLIGKFNLDTFFVEVEDYKETHSKYYIRMVEMGIGEKFRIEWMKNKLEEMADDRDDSLGEVRDCFVKKPVPAAAGGAQKKSKVEGA